MVVIIFVDVRGYLFIFKGICYGYRNRGEMFFIFLLIVCVCFMFDVIFMYLILVLDIYGLFLYKIVV